MEAPVRHHLCSVDKQTCQSVHEQDCSKGDPGPGLCTGLCTVSQIITGNRSEDPFWGGATTNFPLIYTCGDGVRHSWQCSALSCMKSGGKVQWPSQLHPSYLLLGYRCIRKKEHKKPEMFPGLKEQLDNMWCQLPVIPVVTGASPEDWLQ